VDERSRKVTRPALDDADDDPARHHDRDRRVAMPAQDGKLNRAPKAVMPGLDPGIHPLSE
jgi:hypothetical protein